MISITRSVVDVVQAALPLPEDMTDKAALEHYFAQLSVPLAGLVAEIAQAVQAGKLGVIGASQDEIRAQVAEELDARAAYGVNPALVEAIITIVLFVLERLRKQ